MKAKAIIPLVLGLCVGLVAVKFLVTTLQNARGSTSDAQKTAVVRAKLDIESYAEITAEMVELIPTPDSALIPPGERLDKVEDVTGRVAAKAIPRHSPVLRSMLAPEGTLPGMKGKIKPGFRAVSVKISEVSGVAYHIKPGDWVDVIVVMDVDTGGLKRKKETIAEVILQHVEVVAIGQTTGDQPGETGRSIKPAKSATLLVAEEDAPKLHLAGTRGKLTLALRGDDDLLTSKPPSARETRDFDFARQFDPNPATTSAGDTSAGAPGGFLTNFLAAAATTPTPQPTRVEPQPHSVTVYHGTTATDTQIEQVAFADGDSRVVVAVAGGPVSRMPQTSRSEARRPPRGPRSTVPRTDRVDSLPVDEEPDIEDQEVE